MRFQHNSLFARTGLLLSCALLFSACYAPDHPVKGSPTAPVVNAPTPTLTVVGQGTATAKPDIARMSLGVRATAPTVSEALSKGNSQMSAVINAVKRAGVADKDIRTSNFSIGFEQPDKKPAFYRVSNMVDVKVRDLNNAGVVLESAVNAGANSVWNVSFDLDDTTAVEAQARTDAVADARTRAEDLARLNGLRLGPVASISTIIGGSSGSIQYAASERADRSATPLEAGELTRSTQVEVVFKLMPAPGAPATQHSQDG